MDPNATVQLINTAESFEIAIDHAQDLRDWLCSGGFQPDWNKMTTFAWKALMAVDYRYARRLHNNA